GVHRAADGVGVDEQLRALADADEDVAGHARDPDVAALDGPQHLVAGDTLRGHRGVGIVDAQVARDHLGHDGVAGLVDGYVAGHGLEPGLAADPGDLHVAARGLHAGAPGHLVHEHVAGRGLDVCGAVPAAGDDVGRGGTGVEIGAVWTPQSQVEAGLR